MAAKPKIRTKTLPLFHETAKTLLATEWIDVLAIQNIDAARDAIWGGELAELILNGGSTYPYMLVGQVLAKASKGDINAMSIQDSSSLAGSVDMRMLVKNVVTPWNQANGKPFPGTNLDPYVNNPARYKNFGDEMESKAGNREQYKRLLSVVQHVQHEGQQEAKRLLRLILIEARRSLETNKRDYVGPSRASLQDVTKVLSLFYAIFKSFAEAYPNFGQVQSYSTNSSDASGNRIGDIEKFLNGKVQYAVEVKDRALNLRDVETSIEKARVAGVNDLLFLVHSDPLIDDSVAVMARCEHEYTRGIDVNIKGAMSFFSSVLLLLSPEQRAGLLRAIHDALHELGAHYKHVQSWLELMRSI
jgi:SacI restriction endonuclease